MPGRFWRGCDLTRLGAPAFAASLLRIEMSRSRLSDGAFESAPMLIVAGDASISLGTSRENLSWEIFARQDVMSSTYP